jgi:hypothetical protein
MMPWFEKLGGRKFLLAASSTFGGFVLAVFGKLTGDYVTIASISVGAFSLANASTTNAALKAGKEDA